MAERGLFTVSVCLLPVACVLSERAVEPEPSVLSTMTAPAPNERPRLIFENEALKFVAVGYGDSSRGGKQQTPGFYVFSKTHSSWVRIDEVSTRGAVLGRTPTFKESRVLPGVGWDFRRYEAKDYIPLPLSTGGSICFPENIALDENSGEWVLTFHSSWKVDAALTVLRFRHSELEKKLSAAARK